MFYSDSGNRLRFSDVKKVLDNKYCTKFDKLYVKTVGAPSEKISEGHNVKNRINVFNTV